MTASGGSVTLMPRGPGWGMRRAGLAGALLVARARGAFLSRARLSVGGGRWRPVDERLAGLGDGPAVVAMVEALAGRTWADAMSDPQLGVLGRRALAELEGASPPSPPGPLTPGRPAVSGRPVPLALPAAPEDAGDAA
jgi:hypothetical protein